MLQALAGNYYKTGVSISTDCRKADCVVAFRKHQLSVIDPEGYMNNKNNKLKESMVKCGTRACIQTVAKPLQKTPGMRAKLLGYGCEVGLRLAGKEISKALIT